MKYWLTMKKRQIQTKNTKCALQTDLEQMQTVSRTPRAEPSYSFQPFTRPTPTYYCKESINFLPYQKYKHHGIKLPILASRTPLKKLLRPCQITPLERMVSKCSRKYFQLTTTTQFNFYVLTCGQFPYMYLNSRWPTSNLRYRGTMVHLGWGVSPMMSHDVSDAIWSPVTSKLGRLKFL